ncbi:hypothetical protein V1514DRAFT_30584 [Lipomyces japonicus]|uniref:uncharacterized protein n=1 Tax=Lipomyces japonicus TaxID=56871 RepID=UPI0034CD3B2B
MDLHAPMFRSVATAVPDATVAAHNRALAERDTSQQQQQQQQHDANAHVQAAAAGIDDTLDEMNWSGRDSSRALDRRIVAALAQIDAAAASQAASASSTPADLVAALDRAMAEAAALERNLAAYRNRLS